MVAAFPQEAAAAAVGPLAMHAVPLGTAPVPIALIAAAAAAAAALAAAFSTAVLAATVAALAVATAAAVVAAVVVAAAAAAKEGPALAHLQHRLGWVEFAALTQLVLRLLLPLHLLLAAAAVLVTA